MRQVTADLVTNVIPPFMPVVKVHYTDFVQKLTDNESKLQEHKRDGE